MDFAAIGLSIPFILLPKPGIDMSKWAVIACDQYTSAPEYWEKVSATVGKSPSTLNLIFPEVYLEEAEADAERRITGINATMQHYLDAGILQEEAQPGFILVDRQTCAVPSRKGLVVALDLEAYDYRDGATTLIRATEGTILDRLPPRIKVRQGASIELPHIMVLIDDPERTVIEPLFDRNFELAYDFELMEGGGQIKGWRVNDGASIAQVGAALAQLADPARFAEKYQVAEQAPVLYAMGDGNHSFATAKAIWEKLKVEAPDPAAIMEHPARYALVELVNVHDPGLEFEAIHRVIFNADLATMTTQAEVFYAAQGASFRCERCVDLAASTEKLKTLKQAGRHLIPFVAGAECGLFVIDQPPLHLEVATLQTFLDHFLSQNRAARIDYIHGEAPVSALGGKAGNIGFYLPAISKYDFFKTIILDGALPRKTFSMGDADEKRFYLECRRIVR